MHPVNHVIKSKEDLLNHFGSSLKLQILDLEQMEKLLEMDVPPEIWKDASNRNLLSFNQEFVLETYQFTLTYKNIQYIDLLSFLTSLTELNLQCNKISDISAISKIRILEILDLSDNGIEDISTLQSLSDLMYLTEICLQDNYISDISSISQLKNLKKLDLSSNSIQDIAALQYLLDLTHLNLSENNLTTYTIALPHLLDLNISKQFVDTQFITRMNQLQDISGLQHSPKLECLYLSETKTTDLSTISHQMFTLKELILSWNNITVISYLSNFVDLQILNLCYNQQLQNIGPLKFCTQLTKLVISNTNITDIWPLQFMINLNTLFMAETKVDDLHPLQYLYKLENISAYRACIIDVSPLSDLTQLQKLTICQNKITNLDTIKHHNYFSKFNVSGQKVPTTNELKFYNKILKIHSSHKQIRTIQIQNRIQKFRISLTQKKNTMETIIDNYARKMNTQLEILFYFIESSNTYQQLQ
ncbi:Conserved_hypothetical protein [Hexamita inflata]|uniref:Uncharacterized protein n=1 Tax=Hexamita inflata TaxID=28002 RepID=A0AA86QVL3_9EUKA|nr:Conserved hypothetical protein [Hexamita inflata]